MKRLFSFFAFFACVKTALAQVRLPQYSDSLFTTYYHQRITHFRSLPQTKGDIIFLGNSITDGGEWSELFNDVKIKNRGISGDVSAGVLNRLDDVAGRKPAKVFLLIGINDLARGVSPDSVLKNILLIATYLKQQTPATQLFVQSLLPVNDAFGKFTGHVNKREQIRQVNEKLKQNAALYRYQFIDLHTAFCDGSGRLKKELTNDGLHLLGKGYLLWKHLVYADVYGLQERASLLPLPQKLQWTNGYFPLYACRSLVIHDTALRNEALWFQQALKQRGVNLSLSDKAGAGQQPIIKLQTGKVSSPLLNEEAYQLDVSESEVVLTANTPHGIFNGLQTLLQLANDRTMIDACTVTDWPAFAWRGYMIDVGRNYASMKLLKQQIDVMAAYKLNVFHFHPTEDVAWRIGSKQYPQLTAPEAMLRNNGQYYSEAGIKELIRYCKERYITFVPEIDMPGHSGAFKRALKTDMQSDSGLLIVKNLLKEFCATYDVPYIHIGADEVKIANQNFIPEVTALLQRLGKKVIGWQPGGNFTANTVRQLWMDDHGKITGGGNIQYIDSRHLYINHMDPLESVVSIFNRQVCNRPSGDASALGGTLCLWNDRRVSEETDLLRMNPVYPAMLAFSERVWRGGGQPGWIANESDGDVKSFAGFEARLLDQKTCFFQIKPFPYVRQSNLVWQLYGPFKNSDTIAATFSPKEVSSNAFQTRKYKQVTGGTVVLRHWWYPLIKGAVDVPEENTTFYAVTKIWSDEEGEERFWIGFNNLSRSPATDSPPTGRWDGKESAVWVNEKLIAPPRWNRGGQKGHSEIPLTDEGYEYREPTKITLTKGWNTVLIKAPVSRFKGADWQNPVKWMFTFVRVGD